MKLLARIATIITVVTLGACSDANQVVPDLSLQSRYSAQARELGQLKIDEFTSAPLQYFGVVRLNATPETVYGYVGDLESISEWLPVAGEVTRLDHSNS